MQLTNSGGALPATWTAATNYWIIRVDANTIKLASSQANALAGTAIANPSDNGTGTQTETRRREDIGRNDEAIKWSLGLTEADVTPRPVSAAPAAASGQ